MSSFLDLCKALDPLAIILGLAVIAAVVIGWRATHNKDTRFDFEELFLDELGRTSLYKLGQFIALVFSTWGFVYLTLEYKLSEWYFTAYMLAWAGANVANKYVETKKAPTVAPTAKKPIETKDGESD